MKTKRINKGIYEVVDTDDFSLFIAAKDILDTIRVYCDRLGGSHEKIRSVTLLDSKFYEMDE